MSNKVHTTLFSTPEEYQERFEQLMHEYEKLKKSEKYPGEHSAELTRIWKTSRYYCSSISISLLDVSQNLPLMVFCSGEKLITHVSLHTRKDWDKYGEIEYAAFWASGQSHREAPLYREPNRYNSLTGTYIPIPRSEAIRIGFEADTSSRKQSSIQDERRALEIRAVPIQYSVKETDEYMREKLLPKVVSDSDIEEMLK